MQDARRLLAVTRAGVPAPLDGSHQDSPFSALRPSPFAQLRKRNTAPRAPEPEAIEVKDAEGRVRMRCHKGVIVVNPGS